MPVSVDAVDGWPKFSFSNGEFVITNRVMIDWADFDAYALELAPPATINSGSLGAPWPLNSNFRVRSFEMFPLENTPSTSAVSGVNQYEKALADVEYAVPETGELSDPNSGGGQSYDPVTLLKHSMDSGGVTIGAINIGMKYFGDNVDLNENAKSFVYQPTTSHVLNWPQVVAPNWAALEKLKGHVNFEPFLLRGFLYATDTVLYTGYSASQDTMTDGARAWNITLKFEVKYVKAYRYTGSVYTKLAADGSDFYGGWNWVWRENPPEASLMDTGQSPEVGWYPTITKLHSDQIDVVQTFTARTVYPYAYLTELFLRGV